MRLSRAFARVVRRILDRTRTSIRDLSHRADIPERTLHSIVHEHQTVNLDQAQGIAKALNMEASELVSEAEGLAEGRS